MTREEIVKELEDLQEGYDSEGGHSYADSLLTAFLRKLGYDDIVDAYEKLDPKWYV